MFIEPIMKLRDLKIYLEKKHHFDSKINFLKNGVIFTLKQESIYHISQIVASENVLTLHIECNNAISEEIVSEIIEISDEKCKPDKLNSKIKKYTDSQIGNAEGLERDKMVFFNNLIHHNMIYLLEKEKITNQTTVLGIVDVAWCKRKSKLLLNIASNQRNPSSKILKWIDRINILEFNLSKLYCKIQKKKKISSGDCSRIEEEIITELSNLKTAQTNLEKTMDANEADKKPMEKKKEENMHNITLEQSHIESMIKDIKLDFTVHE